MLLCTLSVLLTSCSTEAENLTKETENTVPALSSEIQNLAASQTDFAFELYHQLSSKDPNVFLSPYSISSALAMTFEGAAGETKEEMEQVLHFKSGEIAQAFGDLNTLLTTGSEGKDAIILNTENSLWLQTGESYLPNFQSTIVKYYKGGLQQVDYKADPDHARKSINDWVEEKTKGKIRDLLQSKDIDDSTRLVLVNAIYMKAAWLHQFDKQNTKHQPFHTSLGDKNDVFMMETTHSFNYGKEDNFAILELPYHRGEGQELDLAMFIFLPDDIDGLADVEKKLNGASFREWINKMQMKKVNVSLPRFKINDTFRLKDTLEGMGMKVAFSNAADFSGITGKKELSLSQVIHKTFIDVDENGTEAAAATAAVIALTAAPTAESPVEFKVDHPFFFALVDKNSGTLLFMGRVKNPPPCLVCE